MRALLISPPVAEPAVPPLGPLVLRTRLRRLGIRADFVDLNLGFHNWFIGQPPRSAPAQAPAALAAEAALLADVVPGSIDSALPVLQGKTPVSDPARFGVALRSLASAYAVRSAGWFPWRVSLGDLEGPYDTARPDDILRATADGANPAAAYLRTVLPSLMEGTDAVGISIGYTSQIIPGLTLARMLREARGRDRRPLIMVGGGVINRWGRRLAAFPSLVGLADLFCRGHGEVVSDAIPGLIAGRVPVASVPNLIAAVDGQTVVTPARPMSRRDAEELVDMTDLPRDYWLPLRTLPVSGGRGCYWGRCNFCGTHLAEGLPERRCYRPVSIDYLVRQIQHVAAQGVGRVILTNESTRPSEVSALAQALHRSRLEVSFSARARPEPGFPRAMAARFKSAGCELLAFGFESAVDRVLQLMNKGTSARWYSGILEACAAAGVQVIGHFLLGFPGETQKEAEETVRFIEEQRERIRYPIVSCFTVEVSSPVHLDPGRFGCTLGADPGLALSLPHETSAGWGVREARAFWREAVARLGETFGDPLLSNPALVPFLKPGPRTAGPLQEEQEEQKVALSPRVRGVTWKDGRFTEWQAGGGDLPEGDHTALVNLDTLRRVTLSGWGARFLPLCLRPATVASLVARGAALTGAPPEACTRLLRALLAQGILVAVGSEGGGSSG
ncbi:MAG: radical SAM protein [Acetobacteraceae bacterium]|nr:radical SAM protein [Acetobacteraceae bacterium]